MQFPMENITEVSIQKPMKASSEKPRRGVKSDEHRVTLSITISKAFPTEEEEPKPNIKGTTGIKGRRRVFEAPKPQHYFHLEYKLLPDDEEAVKTDVVTYGVAAKIYTESDSKVLKTWKEGNKTWIAWTHSHKLTITKDLLLKMYNHTLELKIWDTKDKVSPRARFDRPKAFRLPMADDESDESCVKSMVMNQTTTFKSLQPKQSVAAFDDNEESHNTVPGKKSESKQSDLNRNNNTAPSTTFRSTSFSETSNAVGQSSMVHIQIRVDELKTPQFGRLAQLAGVSPPMTEETARVQESARKMSHIKADEGVMTPRRQKSRLSNIAHITSHKPEKQSHPKRQTRRATGAAAAHVRNRGTATVSISLALFFSELKAMTSRLEKPSGNIQDLFLSVSLDKNLLSESQRKDLNPMVIQVNSATSLPNTPLSYKQAKQKCKPVHLEYQFYNLPKHISAGREHGRQVYWHDMNVVLLGTMSKDMLAEYLQGPPLLIEVHDRDRKGEHHKLKPSLFGEKPDDEMINNVALVAGRRTTHNPFLSRKKSWDPYGIARFDLSGLLLGQTLLELRSAIHCCPTPDTNLGHETPTGPIVGHPGNVDGPEERPLPTANYLESGSELKIKVNLAYPLHYSNEQTESSQSVGSAASLECPFGRVVYTFEYTNSKFLRRMQSEVTAINAQALELESLPQHVIEAALSTYKLAEDQKKSKSLDIITGFQVLDGDYHMFVLEGIAEAGIKRLWTRLTRPREPDATKFNVLYNSEMLFSSRVYASLDVDLCRVRLHEPLSIIVQNPLLYVRDLVPRLCFDALTKLDKLFRVTKLREATQSDLFPTTEMIISMSREFGVPLTAADFGDLESEKGLEERKRFAILALEHSKTSRPWTPIETHNIEYEKRLKERAQSTSAEKDFISGNITNTRTDGKDRPQTIAADRVDLQNKPAHNYSIQTVNSTQLAKDKLRHILAQEKNERYTYCLEHNSAMVSPVDLDAVKKQQHLESVQKWQTPCGFVFPGNKTSIQSNAHHNKPNSARLDELNKPWKENILHSNILKPTVDREIFTWPYRDKDFNLNVTSHQPPCLDPAQIKSIHSAGDSKDLEIHQSQIREARLWREKLVVDSPFFRTHRCLTDTELKARGPLASNQPAKLVGLLKDPPNKLALRKPGLALEEISSLSVVMNPSVDTVARTTGNLALPLNEKQKTCGFNPGPFEKRGWLFEKNKIPILDSQHKKFSALRGQDFRVFYKDKDALYQRHIEPLQPEEKDNHLFAVADPCS